MHQIYGLEVDSLTIDAVKDILLIQDQIDLDKAQEGKQPSGAFVLGKLCSTSEATVQPNGKKRRQLILQEVKQDGGISNQKFEVFVYGAYIVRLDACLASIRQQTCWIVFRKITLSLTHRRNRSELSRFVIRLHDEDCRDCVIVPVFPKQRHITLDTPYTDIASLRADGKCSVFAVVNSVLKDAQPTKTGARHSLFAITDPSCQELRDILLHVFFNKAAEQFPCTVVNGDVIRISNMLVEHFEYKKPNGKVFSPNSIRIFRKEEDSIAIYSEKSNYIYTRADQAMVAKLRSWRDANQDYLPAVQRRRPNKNTSNPPHVAVKSLSEIKQSCSFDLECQVVQMKEIPDKDIVQLRVVDGTTCSIYVTELDYDDPERYMNSQTDKAVMGADFIDIVIFKPLADAKKLQPKEFVRLHGIQCSEIADMSLNTTDQLLLYDFQMDEGAAIRPISDLCCGSVRQIVRRMKVKCSNEQSQRENETSQGSIIQFVRNVANEKYSDNFLSQNTPATNPPSPCRSQIPTILSPRRSPRKSNPTQVSPMDVSGSTTLISPAASGVSRRSILSPSKNSPSNNSPSKNSPLRSNIQESTVSSPTSPIANVTKRKANLSPAIGSPVRSNTTKSTDCTDMLGPTPENDSVRRIIGSKSQYSAHREELHFVESNCEENIIELTIDDASPFTPLRDYLADKNNMELKKLRLRLVKLKVISVIAKPKGGVAANLLWGLCPNCGVAYSSVELRESYSTRDLTNLDYLFCVRCRPQKRARGIGYPYGGAVTPYFCGTLLLCDPLDGSVAVKAKLTGDEAESCFGIKPAFKFVLNAHEDVKAVLDGKFRKNNILDLNLIRRECSSQGIYIC